jgi:hypothetical protein
MKESFCYRSVLQEFISLFIYLFVTIIGANLTIFPKENEAKQTPQPQDNEKE